MGKGARRKIIITLTLLLGACATVSPPNPSEGIYKKDLEIIESSNQFFGFGVLPKKNTYKLHIRSRKEPELVRLSNCHRDIIDRDVDDDYRYTYIPNDKIEDGSCILQITFLDSKGYHQFGAISFRDEDETLHAEVVCNGQVTGFEGASACQAKAGTLQIISFDSYTEVRGSEGCKLPHSTDGYEWKYSVRESLCVFYFKSEDGTFHKHTTFGYTDVLQQ